MSFGFVPVMLSEGCSIRNINVNRATPPQSNQPYTNGHYETPLEVSGVSLRPPAPVHKPTVFPADLPLAGLGPIFYGMQRFHLGGMPFSRYISALWIAIAFLAAFGALPGRWITMTLALLVWVVQITLATRLQRLNYISFTSAPLPALFESPLDTSEKLPVYATGLLSVEGRYQKYSALPGFYRTFATGEHAVLCRVQERNWLGMLSWPADETGMWYAFIYPTDIIRMTWGIVHFGATTFPGLAVEYRLELPPDARRKKPEIRQETLYLATPEAKDAQRLYVDLLTNLPSEQVVAPLSTSA
jgi:hypothetical protein